MAQGKASPNENGSRKPPKTSTKVQGSGRASPVEAKPRMADDDMEGLFVDPAPAGKNKSGGNRAADRRRERGQSPPPPAAPDTRSNLPNKEQAQQANAPTKEKRRPSTQARVEGAKSLARAVLTCTRGPEEGLALQLLEGSYTIGRARENSFVLKDIAASRKHMRIEVDGRGARLIDLGSGNGTRVNGKRISEHVLKHGDRIEIGGSILQFTETGRPPPGNDVDDAQERVIRAAEALAAELSEKMKFDGDASASGFDDGHAASTGMIGNGKSEKSPKANGNNGASQAQPAANNKRPSTKAADKLWNETFTNLPLDKVVPANEPLRGQRAVAAESMSFQAAGPPPQARPQPAPLPRPPPLPLPEPFPELEVSTTGGRGSMLFNVMISALIVIVIGATIFGVYIVKSGVFSKGDTAAQSDIDVEFEKAKAECEKALAAKNWSLAVAYGDAALRLRKNDLLAGVCFKEAKRQLEAELAAPPPPPPSPPPPSPPPPVEAQPTPTPVETPVNAVATPPPAPPPVVATPPPPPPPPPRAAPPPPREKKPPPPPKEKKVSSKGGMTEERAAVLFEDAVDALRDRDNKKGCKYLEDIADKAPPDSVWKGKAEKLYARRCD